MKVSLVRHTLNPDELAGMAAALCSGSRNPDKARDMAMISGHESISEHACFTFLIEGVSRVLLAQITRHRLASFSVQSQRYTGIQPEWIVPPQVAAKGFKLSYLDSCDRCYRLFCDMVACGVPAEDARYAIPQGVTCNLLMTMNVRELRHFLSLRCCNRAQWEIRNLADEMMPLCYAKAPCLFADAGPGCVRGDCREARPCGMPRTYDPKLLDGGADE